MNTEKSLRAQTTNSLSKQMSESGASVASSYAVSEVTGDDAASAVSSLGGETLGSTSTTGTMANLMGSLVIGNETEEANVTTHDHHNDERKQPPKSSSGRVVLNKKKSDLDKFFHHMNPDSVKISSNKFAWSSLMVAPVLQNDMEVNVSSNGRRAKIKLTFPAKVRDPNNLFGHELGDSHVLYQSLEEEVNSRRKRKDAKDTANIGLKLPFKAETRTSDELFGPGTGQSAGFIAVHTKKQLQEKKKPRDHPGDKTCHACFVFKEEGSAFNVKTSVTTKVFDNMDLNGSLSGRGTSGTNAGSGNSVVAAPAPAPAPVAGAASVPARQLTSNAASAANALNPASVPLPMDVDQNVAANTRASAKKRKNEDKSN